MTGCILWTGMVNRATGYGTRRINGRSVYVHREAWELEHGPIPDGLHTLEVRREEDA